MPLTVALMIVGAVIAIAGPLLTITFMNEGVQSTDEVRVDKKTGDKFRQTALFLSTNGTIVAFACAILGLTMIVLPAFASMVK
jgi:ABC-type cobalamin transport system permease subunit